MKTFLSVLSLLLLATISVAAEPLRIATGNGNTSASRSAEISFESQT